MVAQPHLKSMEQERAVPRASERAGSRPTVRSIAKAPTFIEGFDEITRGGLPRGRVTLVHGPAGSGKTVFALECVARAAERADEPACFMTFGETPAELVENAATIGLDLVRLASADRFRIASLRVPPASLTSEGGYPIETLLEQLQEGIESIGAQRLVIDSLNMLTDAVIDRWRLRADLRRVFDWLKERHVTTVVTLESTRESPRRVEDYVADCIVSLDVDTQGGVATRRLQVVKYRGSGHGGNRYPFSITARGLRVTPVTGVRLDAPASTERVSTGVAELDRMLGGGIFRGAAFVVVGEVGTGKSTLATHLVDAACARGEKCLYIALEESPDQIVRNMRSVGFDLRRWIEHGSLDIYASRPGSEGLEVYLEEITRKVDELQPHVVALDPLMPLRRTASEEDERATLVRLVSMLKARGITAVYTLLGDEADFARSKTHMTSLVDTIVLLRNIERGGERGRALTVVKARGTPHSKEVREFELTSLGVDIDGKVTDAAPGPHATRAPDGAAGGAAGPPSTVDPLARARRRLLQLQVDSIEAQLELER